MHIILKDSRCEVVPEEAVDVGGALGTHAVQVGAVAHDVHDCPQNVNTPFTLQ